MTDVGLPFRQEGSASLSGTSEASVGDFLALLKPRVMSLVVFTALTGMVMAPGHLHPVVAFASLLAIAVGAGASGALNMWYDADIDRLMTRTRERPVAAGRVSPDEALAFGLILSGLAVLTLGVVANWVAGGLLAFTILFYVVIYTMGLKRRTPQNIVIGGAAGAFPPMVAWAAVTGNVTLAPVVLFAIIFLWTPPHFWALALFKSGDYARAGVPMLPVVAGERETRRQVLLYSIVLAPLGVLPWWLGFASAVYGAASGLLGVLFLVRAVAVWREREGYRAARRLFGYSLVYLFALFALLLGDAVVPELLALGHSLSGLLA